ncbi:Protein PHLOEM PROTEIN 2-LIKE A9 [Camellia lanceoleosa]|uniref:Protein PHLOEM PROTEIN 2-LIKE A9 n=1 Tax=Camellia lanceoleosa TaxID=1840588 RepID=A0ACC0GL36_9ERIC|nr:Protein PHLOEM PROTEIN 2-LIKE A9 [Camellia lanceoleosa]
MGEQQKNIIKPKDLKIVWSSDNRYWRMPTQPDQPAELLQVCWLEVTGSCPIDKGKKYNVSFEVSLTPDAFGWNNTTLYIMAKIGEKGRYTWKKVNLTNQNTNKDQRFSIPHEQNNLIVDTVADASDDKLYFGLYEIWKGNWKGGLKIYHAVVKEVN